MGLAGVLCSCCVLSASAVWPPEGHKTPILLFGPTANQPETIANETLSLLANQDVLGAWSEVRGRLTSSGGALHVRQQVVSAFMTDAQRQLLAEGSAAAGIAMSIEAGGEMCIGTGAASGQNFLKTMDAFLSNGGRFKFFGLESVFSRTHRSKTCPAQSLQTTANELADYAAAIAVGSPGTTFFLYDALPHFAVASFPANDPQYNMELIDVLTMLRDAMAANGVTLAGYWLDCPYEYSRDLQDADGFEKIAEAVKLVRGMGLEVGKTFNSQEGGSTGNEQFYTGAMADFHKTIEKVPSSLTGGYSFDYAMVESWYSFPDAMLPETQQYTTSYTTRALFREIRQDVALV